MEYYNILEITCAVILLANFIIVAFHNTGDK